LKEGDKMFKLVRRRKAKGFTLVELLIVMVIIGILAGAMLLVMGPGKDKANATKIVSNLRSLKVAALMYYSDNNSWPTNISQLDSYMDRKVPTSDDLATYTITYTITSGDSIYFIGATLSSSASTGLKNKLRDMATESGLYDEADSSDTIYSGDEDLYVRLGS
jgi:general secretion pathway protein G